MSASEYEIRIISLNALVLLLGLKRCPNGPDAFPKHHNSFQIQKDTTYIYTFHSGRLSMLYHTSYLSFFFTQAKFLENKIYTEKTGKLRQNTQKIANFLRYYGKIHSKLPIFRVKSVKIYTGQKKFTRIYSWRS